MEHKVTMTIELTVESPAANVKEEVEGTVYWFMHSSVESHLKFPLDRDVVIKDFNIEIN
jgi:hypothetical protein